MNAIQRSTRRDGFPPDGNASRAPAPGSPCIAVKLPSAMRLRVLTLAFVQAMAVLPLTVMAQTPNTGPINQSNTGTQPPDQSGQQGGTPSDITVTVKPGQVVGDSQSTSTPDILMVSQGGQGATGVDNSGGTTGDGGAGGNGGHVQLNLGAQTAVSSMSTATAAVNVASDGGTGGTAGKMGTSTGYPGHPGYGGSGAPTNGSQVAVTLIQSGTVQSTNGWNGSTPGTTAILLQSIGGNAAQPLGSDGAEGPHDVTGPRGSNGGNGGDINYSLDTGFVKSAGAAVVVLSKGGDAGDGTEATSTDGTGNGGDGGNGGNGGVINIGIARNNPSVAPVITATGASQAAAGVVIPIDQNGNTGQAAVLSAGIQAQSIGGVGGDGGGGHGTTGGVAGQGGPAGSGSSVTVQMGSTQLSTTGFAAAGVLAQSIGGSGGTGASAGSIFSTKASKGGSGGDGGAVSITLSESTGAKVPTSLISTQGDDSMAIVAQSIGGGGGAGGAVAGGSLAVGVTIGGNGETGGNGGTVTLANGSSSVPGLVISTAGEHSSGLIAQSIGGGGGSGGSANSASVALFSYTVGGTGGTGGSAGTVGTTQVTVENDGIVSTTGDHAKGVVAQAVGGGGGDGGSAQSVAVSGLVNISATVGGSSGKGGTAGDVYGTNNGQIVTAGADAWGLLVQSVSGGGGNAGMSKSDAFTAAAGGYLTVDVTVGGKGGNSGSSGNVTGQNSDVIMTGGAGAHGLMVQSVTGSGGNGGSSSIYDLTLGAGGDGINTSLAVGGNGGNGGNSGTVTANNAAGAVIWTLGDTASAIYAQSVGGGGGQGGTGTNDSKFVVVNAGKTSSYSSTIGGSGGSGTTGGTVNVSNDGVLFTMLDGSHGVFAQSVGGGGGKVGGGTGNGSGIPNINYQINIGGDGVGGTGGAVTVNNTGLIKTNGGDSAAIYAQSIGGGGGKSGSGATAGLPVTKATPAAFLQSTSSFTTQSYAGVQAYAPGAWQGVTMDKLNDASQEYLNFANGQLAPLPSDSTSMNMDLDYGVGGGRGAANPDGGAPTTSGDGGAVTVSNTGQLNTSGPLSAGIWAQSIGAGGGDAGAVNATQLAVPNSMTMKATINLGGYGQNSGDGGTVSVNNTGGLITTAGDASFGVFAQSVGGGGGTASLTSSTYQPDPNPKTGGGTTLNLGGMQETTGNGGAVTVTHGTNWNMDPAPATTITTQGWDAVGIVAQSIGGGGGTAAFMQTKPGAYNNYAMSNTYPQGLADVSINVGDSVVNGGSGTTLGCSLEPNGQIYNACGAGGPVTVKTDAGNVYTSGRNAHGILAQSIGGGGGWVVGISPASTSSPFTNGAMMAGPGGDVNVTVSSDIVTTGDGAYGVLAQSIGGGGVLGGDLAAANSPIAFPGYNGTLPRTKLRVGDGGAVTVGVAHGAVVHTKGANAHAVFAQSVGGGGGLWATQGGLMVGSMGGAGHIGEITVTNSGTIQADGNGASAVYVNSAGNPSTSFASVTNNADGQIIGNSSAPAIILSGGNSNGDGQVINAGSITSGTGGTAVSAPSSFAVVTNQAGGRITGDLQLGENGAFTNSGYWGTGTNSTVGGVVTSTGTIDVNAAGQHALGLSVLNGDLMASGTIQQTVDFEAQQATALQVTGIVGQSPNSTLTFSLTPTKLLPNTVPLIQGMGGLILPGATATDQGGMLFNYSLASDGNVISVTPSSNLMAPAPYLSNNQLQTASYLDSNFVSTAGDAMATTYAGLSSINSITGYQAALNNLSSENVQAASAARLGASHAFVERMNSCPQFEADSLVQRERDCGWARIIGTQSDHRATSDSVGFRQNSQALQVGGQYEVAKDWFVGGSLAYDQSQLNSHSVNGSMKGSGWTGGLVLKHQMGDWLVSGAIDGGSMSYDASRQVSVAGINGAASTRFDVRHFGVHSRIARQISLGSWYLKPYVDLHASRVSWSGYTEQGVQGLALQVNGSKQNVFSAAPMLEVGSRFDLDGGKTMRLYGGLGGAFYNASNFSADMRFIGGAPGTGTFNISTEVPRQRLKASLGAEFKASDRLNVRLEYSGEFARSYRSGTGTLKLSYLF